MRALNDESVTFEQADRGRDGARHAVNALDIGTAMVCSDTLTLAVQME
jgi:hypothetical protein